MSFIDLKKSRNIDILRIFTVFSLIFLVVWIPSIKIIFYNTGEDIISTLDLLIISVAVSVIASVLALPLLWFRKSGLLLMYVLFGLATAALINTFMISFSPNVLDGVMESDGGLLLKRAVTFSVIAAALLLWIFRLRGKTFVFPIARAVTVGVFAYAGFFSAIALWSIPAASSLLLQGPAEDLGLQLSPERNILVISFDQMQGSMAGGVLRRNPELAAKFDGFKFFTDAASVYPNTSYSLASVLLGRMPKGPEDAYDIVFTKENIIRASREKGYAAGFAAAEWKCEICIPKIPANFGRGRVAEKAAQIYSLAAQQAFGMGVRTVAFLTRPFVPQKLGPTAAKVSWKLDVDAFKASVQNAGLTSDKPVVQYRHYYVTHQPIVYDRNCRVKAEQDIVDPNQDLKAAEAEVTCALTSFGQLIDKLKELGVYDRTLLIVASDHGYESNINNQINDPLARELLFSGSNALGAENIKPAGSYNPSLFFKDFGARGHMTEAGTPASLLDIPATVCEAIGGCGFPLEGQSLKNEIANDRARHYWRYFGGKETRFADGEDRLHKGMGKWWDLRSFSGSLVSGLVPSLVTEPPSKHD